MPTQKKKRVGIIEIQIIKFSYEASIYHVPYHLLEKLINFRQSHLLTRNWSV